MISYKGKTHNYNFNSDFSDVIITDNLNEKNSIRIDGIELIKFIMLNAPEEYKNSIGSVEIDYEEMMGVITEGLVHDNLNLFVALSLLKGTSTLNNRDEWKENAEISANNIIYKLYKKIVEYLISKKIAIISKSNY